MPPAIRRFANLEARFLSGSLLGVVRRGSAANTLIRHGDAVVRESSIVHRSNKNVVAGVEFSDGSYVSSLLSTMRKLE